MKVVSLQLSNILSFRYFDDISNAPKITFADDLNIIIGENGSGKSTALEVINFLFKRVLYKQYSLNQELYGRRNAVNVDQRKLILQPTNATEFREFRLEPNWNSYQRPQVIRVIVRLDEIDITNILNILANREKLLSTVGRYSSRANTNNASYANEYTIDVDLNYPNRTFRVKFINGTEDFGFEYLSEYHYYKECISLHNFENPESPIKPLYESFTLISSYRNYHTFNVSVTLRDGHPIQQIQAIRGTDYTRSLNANETSEPPIFGIVRLRVAEHHFDLMSDALSEAQCEEKANDLQFIKNINERLRVVNLSCKIRLVDKISWQYSFEFFDLRRGKSILDINSLSAGQKAIIHLVFEAYGRGDLNGGVVIIDEPEIHLHYQFQHEYLQVIRQLNGDQKCQYILVTHSEALINSSTIVNVRRFSLDGEGHTNVHSPKLTESQKVLIRILDNTRCTYAFFAKKVVLVEGVSDRYFFKAIIQSRYPALDQEIAILDVDGKLNFPTWTKLFEEFGLQVFRIADLDYAYNLFYPHEAKVSLKDQKSVSGFLADHPDCLSRISDGYRSNTFVLKQGDLEAYLSIKKDLSNVIAFCNEKLEAFLLDDVGEKSVEIREILQHVVS